MPLKNLSINSILDVENVSDELNEKWLPLHQACLQGDAVQVETLIRKNK